MSETSDVFDALKQAIERREKHTHAVEWCKRGTDTWHVSTVHRFDSQFEASQRAKSLTRSTQGKFYEFRVVTLKTGDDDD